MRILCAAILAIVSTTAYADQPQPMPIKGANEPPRLMPLNTNFKLKLNCHYMRVDSSQFDTTVAIYRAKGERDHNSNSYDLNLDVIKSGSEWLSGTYQGSGSEFISLMYFDLIRKADLNKMIDLKSKSKVEAIDFLKSKIFKLSFIQSAQFSDSQNSVMFKSEISGFPVNIFTPATKALGFCQIDPKDSLPQKDWFK